MGVIRSYQDVFRDEGDALVQRLRHGVEEDIHAAVTRTAASAFVRTLLEWNGDADARPPTSHAWTTRIFLVRLNLARYSIVPACRLLKSCVCGVGIPYANLSPSYVSRVRWGGVE